MINYIDFEDSITNSREIDQDLTMEILTIPVLGAIYILPDFEITKSICIGKFIVHPTKRINLNATTVSYVSEIEFPDWTNYHNNPEYCRACIALVLSALFSLASERCVKSIWVQFSQISTAESVAIYHPIQFAGRGAIGSPQDSEDVIADRFKNLYIIAMQLDAKSYLDFMRFCRLYQQSMSNRQNDHNLSFSLMVSAIESVATKVVKVEDVKEDWHEVKTKCNDAAKAAGLEGEFVSLLQTKLEQHYSTARFVEFISRNAPLNSLEMPSRYENLSLFMPADKVEEMDQSVDPLNHMIHKYREHPDLSEHLNLKKLIKNTYNYRSNFYHSGISKPNSNPNSQERYLTEAHIPISSPSIDKNDFKDLGLDTEKLWNKLNSDGFITCGKFDNKNIINSLDNEYFGGSGGGIRQVFYRRARKIVRVATFRLMAQIGRVAITKHYRGSVISPPEKK